MKTNIYNDLLKTKSLDPANVEIFSKSTRDKKNLIVKIDKISGVIFIEDYFVGNSEYFEGVKGSLIENQNFDDYENFEDREDSLRRIQHFKNMILNKDICDFGCGRGSFLKLAKKYARKVHGVEIQKNYLSLLNSNGINAEQSIQNFNTKFDTLFLLHTLEHLPNQIQVLEEIKNYIKPKGKIVIEVPHANEFLLRNLKLEEFKNFTLWSQHLILHTKESLTNFLTYSGYKNISIEGIQRYNIANHLYWLRHKKPGGHKTDLAKLETPELVEEYSNSLKKINASDTLIATADV